MQKFEPALNLPFFSFSPFDAHYLRDAQKFWISAVGGDPGM